MEPSRQAAADISGNGAHGYFFGNGLLTTLGLCLVASNYAAQEIGEA